MLHLGFVYGHKCAKVGVTAEGKGHGFPFLTISSTMVMRVLMRPCVCVCVRARGRVFLWNKYWKQQAPLRGERACLWVPAQTPGGQGQRVGPGLPTAER